MIFTRHDDGPCFCTPREPQAVIELSGRGASAAAASRHAMRSLDRLAIVARAVEGASFSAQSFFCADSELALYTEPSWNPSALRHHVGSAGDGDVCVPGALLTAPRHEAFCGGGKDGSSRRRLLLTRPAPCCRPVTQAEINQVSSHLALTRGWPTGCLAASPRIVVGSRLRPRRGLPTLTLCHLLLPTTAAVVDHQHLLQQQGASAATPGGAGALGASVTEGRGRLLPEGPARARCAPGAPH
jgi:hypothetical protein